MPESQPGDRARVPFACSGAEPYDRFALRAWLEQRRAQGAAPRGPVVVEVKHPDREADGSCRWCGDRSSDTVAFDS